MNERIRLLAEQAYTEVMHERGGTYMAFDKEKFAQLIVLKCAEIADIAEPFLASDLIKQQFGVKK